MVTQTMPTIQSLVHFVDEACNTQELMTPTQTNSPHRETTSLLLSQKMECTASRATETPLTHSNLCIACKLQHSLYRCTVINEISYQKRLDLVTGSLLVPSKGTSKVCGRVIHHTPTKDNVSLSKSTSQYNDPTSVMIQDPANITSNVLLTNTLLP